MSDVARIFDRLPQGEANTAEDLPPLVYQEFEHDQFHCP
jgi:hypothetical protein